MSYIRCVQTEEEMLGIVAMQDGFYDRRWWASEYREGSHFATASEVREYLALCMELGESFKADTYVGAFGRAHYPMAAVHYVADLLEKAGWTPSESDMRKLYAPERYLTDVDLSQMQVLDKRTEYDGGYDRPDLMREYLKRHEGIAEHFGGYLKHAPMIATASSLLELLLGYWDEEVLHGRWKYRAEREKAKHDRTCWIRFIKRYRLRKKYESTKAQADIHRELAQKLLWPLRRDLEYCYGPEAREGECALPALGFPVRVRFYEEGTEGTITVEDMMENVGVLVLWDDIGPLRCLGQEKLERALELCRYTKNELAMLDPITGRMGNWSLAGVKRKFPYVPESMYPYCMCAGRDPGEGIMSIILAEHRDRIRKEEGLAVN